MLLRIFILMAFVQLLSGPSVVNCLADATEKKTYMDEFPAISGEFKGDLDKMAEKRLIRVLMPYSRTFYFFDGAQPRGISYDLVKLFDTFINEKFKTKTLKIHVVVLPTAREDLLPLLAAGKGDLAVGNLTITDERLKKVDFSNPISKGIDEILVSKSGKDDLNSIFDLAGKEIHARKSSSYYQSLVKLNATLRSLKKKEITIVEADDHLEDEDLLEMLNAGLIDYMVIDSHKGELWVQIFDKIMLHPEIKFRSEGKLGWAVRKNTPKLMAAVNEFIKDHKAGTLMGNILIKRYFENSEYITNSIYNEHMQRFNLTVRFFKKYGEQYDFDHLMLAALAYQESKLNQNLKSHAGAVGVMQILPSTAKDKNVGIPDIYNLDPNIHAGTKYLRFMADNYFAKDPDLDQRNRALFSFASYNAGPAKVARMRAEAEKMGLDPNQWFGNVEVVAAKRIGRETVQYVSNILKYYVAYKLLEDKIDTEGTVHLTGSSKKKK
ncbi:MAG: transglycosylase SLT domain-containing protein [Desulfocapsaceae bacterium]